METSDRRDDMRPTSRFAFGPLRQAAGILALAFTLCLAPAGMAAAADCMTAPAPETDWQNCKRSNLLLSGADLRDSNLFNADFTLTDLRRSDLRAANLESATLVRTLLAGANADGANFTKVEGYRADFTDVSAKGASFVNAELQRAELKGADLTGADFQKAEAGRANFGQAMLTGSRFTLANLARADLRGARFEGALDFQGAFLFLTRIEGLDLSAATGLEQAQVALACGDEATRLPPGLTIPENWPCTFE